VTGRYHPGHKRDNPASDNTAPEKVRPRTLNSIHAHSHKFLACGCRQRHARGVQQREQKRAENVCAQNDAPQPERLKEISPLIENDNHWIESAFGEQLNASDDDRDESNRINKERNRLLPLPGRSSARTAATLNPAKPMVIPPAKPEKARVRGEPRNSERAFSVPAEKISLAVMRRVSGTSWPVIIRKSPHLELLRIETAKKSRRGGGWGEYVA
jgi:hypothetical protein